MGLDGPDAESRSISLLTSDILYPKCWRPRKDRSSQRPDSSCPFYGREERDSTEGACDSLGIVRLHAPYLSVESMDTLLCRLK
jgi:hypothetical protein